MPRPFSKALKLLREHGRMPQLGKQLGLSRQAPYLWREVPAERVVQIARLVDISPAVLRPDLYEGFAMLKNDNMSSPYCCQAQNDTQEAKK